MQATNSSSFIERHKHKLAPYLKNTFVCVAIATLSSCGLFSSGSSTPTPQPTVSYNFAIPAKNGIPSVVTSYAVANDLYGSPTILPYLNNTTGFQDIISVTRTLGNESLIYWQNDGLGGYTSSVLASNIFNNPWSIMGANINNDRNSR